MKSSLLIVTPQASFGVLVRDGLDPSRFDVFISSDLTDAASYIQKYDCSMALLDGGFEDQQSSLTDIGLSLRKIKADIQFVLVERSRDWLYYVPKTQDFQSVRRSAAAARTRPFSMPELVRLFDSIALPNSNMSNTETPMPEYNKAELITGIPKADDSSRQLWLTDVSKAAQNLTQLTLESAAQAAFITRDNELWAYAGQLSRDAAQELSGSIQRYWSAEGESDLLRFVRLQATQAQHMLYVRKLSHNMNLALVFDVETPFSTIRTQAGKLVKNMFEQPAGNAKQAQSPAENSKTISSVDISPLENGSSTNTTSFSELPGTLPLASPVPPVFTNTPVQPASESSSSAPAVARNPIVNPHAVDRDVQPASLNEQINTYRNNQFDSPPESNHPIGSVSYPFPRPELPRRPLPAMDETLGNRSSASEVESRTVNTPITPGGNGSSSNNQTDLGLTRKQIPSINRGSRTQRDEQPISEPSGDGFHRILLESPSVANVNLSYACLLIPRMDNHKLVNDAAELLKVSVPKLCFAFGWRLELINIQPDYLQWIARVPMNTTAGYFINMIRKHTSDKIFTEIPRFKADNPSGEFWAHGFIVQGGPQPHTQKMIDEFIEKTRKHQGY